MSKRKKQRQASFEILANEARPALRLQADTWRHLLEISAEGMSALLLGNKSPDATSATQMFPVEILSGDFDALLVDWLEELLRLGKEQDMVFGNIQILQLDLEADCRLTAMVEGPQVSAKDRFQLHKVGRPTPRVRESKEGLSCKVFFAPEHP
jgi:SHS2 domain-containing protein